MARHGKIHIGVGGWTYEPWRQTFYPPELRQKDELSWAARQLTAIEINGTFYRTQKPETFQAWHDAVPDGFTFAVKAPRYAVNKRVLAEAGESIRRFVESGLDRLADRLGPILWQLAPTKKYDPDDFAAFLDLLPARAGDVALRHAVELRHPSFACEQVVAACRSRNVAIVLAGDSDYPMIADQTADLSYVRIMERPTHPRRDIPPRRWTCGRSGRRRLRRDGSPTGWTLSGRPWTTARRATCFCS